MFLAMQSENYTTKLYHPGLVSLFHMPLLEIT